MKELQYQTNAANQSKRILYIVAFLSYMYPCLGNRF